MNVYGYSQPQKQANLQVVPTIAQPFDIRWAAVEYFIGKSFLASTSLLRVIQLRRTPYYSTLAVHAPTRKPPYLAQRTRHWR